MRGLVEIHNSFFGSIKKLIIEDNASSQFLQ